MAQPEYTAMSPAEKSLSLRQGSGGSSYPMQLQTYWREFTRELEQCPVDSGEFKNQLLPLARIKKIMKQDEDVRMIAAEAPILFAKACEFFVLELTQRSWNVAEEQKRRTIQINDLSTAIARTEIFDFLMDVVPDPDKAAWSDSGGGCADPNGSCSPAAPPPGPTHTPPSPPLAGSRSPLAFSNSHAALHKAAAGAPPPERHVLALREWRALRPEREVRCFLRGRGIVGACQRDVTQAFAPLQSAAAREELLGAASDFVASVADRLPFGDIVLDVYVGSNKRVRLVDLNPVNGSTAPLLFSWEELGFDGLGGGEAEDRLETRTSCRDSGAEADATAPAAPPSAYLGQLRQAQASARKQHAVEELETGLEARMHVSQPDSKESASAPATSPARSTVPEFRFVREGETPMRPSAAMYGIPYDFVDASEGSALATLLEQAKNATGVWQGLQRQADAFDPKN